MTNFKHSYVIARKTEFFGKLHLRQSRYLPDTLNAIFQNATSYYDYIINQNANLVNKKFQKSVDMVGKMCYIVFTKSTGVNETTPRAAVTAQKGRMNMTIGTMEDKDIYSLSTNEKRALAWQASDAALKLIEGNIEDAHILNEITNYIDVMCEVVGIITDELITEHQYICNANARIDKLIKQLSELGAEEGIRADGSFVTL